MLNKELSPKMINYRKNIPLETKDIIRVFDSSKIVRPTSNPQRIKKMFDNSNLVFSAWDNSKLVGVCRALTDYSYCCYLSDLAVDDEHQNQGIGSELIRLLEEEVGTKVAIVLLSAPPAMEYYPKYGFDKIENGFIIRRQS